MTGLGSLSFSRIQLHCVPFEQNRPVEHKATSWCCCRYHDGYLSSHFATGNYHELDLTSLQQEAIW